MSLSKGIKLKCTLITFRIGDIDDVEQHTRTVTIPTNTMTNPGTTTGTYQLFSYKVIGLLVSKL